MKELASLNKEVFGSLMFTVFLLTTGWLSVSAQKCLDYETPVTLTGRLHSRVFAGPPNYESIRHGDMKEVAILLKLDEPTCTAGNDWPDISYPDVRGIQIVIMNDEHWPTVHRRMGNAW